MSEMDGTVAIDLLIGGHHEEGGPEEGGGGSGGVPGLQRSKPFLPDEQSFLHYAISRRRRVSEIIS
jgi:hypothetical protein